MGILVRNRSFWYIRNIIDMETREGTYGLRNASFYFFTVGENWWSRSGGGGASRWETNEGKLFWTRILLIRWADLNLAFTTNFCMVDAIANVVDYAKFGVGNFKGFWLSRCQFWPLS